MRRTVHFTTGSRTDAALTTDRRRSILDAAGPLFAEKGLRGTSIDDIRVSSGASVGSIYHHFGSKEGVAGALYAAAIADYQTELRGLLRSNPSAESGIKGIVSHFLHWVRAHPTLAQLMLGAEHAELRSLATEDIRKLNRDAMVDLDRWLKSCAPRVPKLPHDLMVAIVLGPSHRFAQSWISKRTRTSIEQAAPVLANAAWAALVGLRKADGLA